MVDGIKSECITGGNTVVSGITEESDLAPFAGFGNDCFFPAEQGDVSIGIFFECTFRNAGVVNFPVLISQDQKTLIRCSIKLSIMRLILFFRIPVLEFMFQLIFFLKLLTNLP